MMLLRRACARAVDAAVGLLLAFGLLLACTGQTLGKLLLRIRVRRLDGGRLGWGRSLLPLGCVLLLVAYGWALVARDHRGLHDRLAGSTVIAGHAAGAPYR